MTEPAPQPSSSPAPANIAPAPTPAASPPPAAPGAVAVAAQSGARPAAFPSSPHRKAPFVCIALTALVLLATMAGRSAFFSTLKTSLPGYDMGVIYPQAQFDNAWKAAYHQAALASGGLSLEVLGRDHQLWRLLTVNLASRECQFGYSGQPMPWMIAIFVLIFIWLSVNIYEMVLGPLRTAGLLISVGLGAGIVASFYHAGFAYPGLLPFFPAVSLAFLFGSFRWKQANLHSGDLYFAPLELLVIGIQCFLCYWFLSDFHFVMIPAIAGGTIAGTWYMYCVPPSKRQVEEGVRFNPKLWYAVGSLYLLILVGFFWSGVDSANHYLDPALRARRLGFSPQDQIVIGYDEKGVVHVATGGPGVDPVKPVNTDPPLPDPGQTTPPPTTVNPPPGPGPTQPPPGPLPTPGLNPVDPVKQKAVFDFDTVTAQPFYAARLECYTQLRVAGWPTEMQLVIKELGLRDSLNTAAKPLLAFKTDQPDLQAFAETLQAEYQAYGAWLDLVLQAGDDNLVTRAGIKAALKKAADLTDRRRKEYLALANTYAIRTASADLQQRVPLFKSTTVYTRAEEFRRLYDAKIGVASVEIDQWMARLEQYRETPVEMKKWIETKDYIKQLKDLRAAVAVAQPADPQIRDYLNLFLAEADGLVDYFEYVRGHAVNNERATWRDIEDHCNAWRGKQAQRQALETTLIDRFNFTNE